MGGRRAKNKQGPPAPYLEVKPDYENSTRRSGGKRKPNVDGANGRPAKKVKPDGTAKSAGKKGGKGKKDEDGDGWEDVDDSGLKSQARCAQCDKYDLYVSLSLLYRALFDNSDDEAALEDLAEFDDDDEPEIVDDEYVCPYP